MADKGEELGDGDTIIFGDFGQPKEIPAPDPIVSTPAWCGLHGVRAMLHGM